MSACLRSRIVAVSVSFLLLTTACSKPYTEDFTLPNGYGTTPAEQLPPSVQAVKDRGELRVGISVDAPGFGLRDPKTRQIEGFDAEMARLISIRIFGTPEKVKFVEVTSAQRPEVLKNGSVDLVAATYTITPERAKIIGFVGPYFNAGQDILVKTGNKQIKNVGGLAGKKVCTQAGTTSLDQLKKAQPQAIVTTTDSYTKCTDGLKNGTFDAVTTDNVILAGIAADSLGTLSLVGELFSDEPYGLGIARDDTDMRTFLNATMTMVFLNGDWNRAWMKTLHHFFGAAPEIPQLVPNPGVV